MSKTINLLSAWNGAGLQQEFSILSHCLEEAGYAVEKNNIYEKSLYATLHKHQYEVNLLCEVLTPFWLQAAPRNFLIPDQEIFRREWIKLLPRVEAVLCKTRHAHEIFTQLGCKAHYMGFTSQDCYVEGVKKREQFFHLAGKSPFKGTETVIQTWKDHPEFPELTIVEHPDKKRLVPELPNLHYIDRVLPTPELRQLQNESLYHLCPSEAEGFGHYLMEALSVKSLVITSDAPPMNELIHAEHGLLCSCEYRGGLGVGVRYHVTPASLANKVKEALMLSSAAKESLCLRGREFYESSKAHFTERFIGIMRSLYPL